MVLLIRVENDKVKDQILELLNEADAEDIFDGMFSVQVIEEYDE